MLTYDVHRNPQKCIMQPARYTAWQALQIARSTSPPALLHCFSRPLRPRPTPRRANAARTAYTTPHIEPTSMPALPIMGAGGHRPPSQPHQQPYTACCCTFPLLRSPSPVNRSPASTLFLVFMVAKSSPPASSFKRGRAADPPCLRWHRGYKTTADTPWAPTGSDGRSRAARSEVSGLRGRAHALITHPFDSPPWSFDFALIVQIRQSRTSTWGGPHGHSHDGQVVFGLLSTICSSVLWADARVVEAMWLTGSERRSR